MRLRTFAPLPRALAAAALAGLLALPWAAPRPAAAAEITLQGQSGQPVQMAATPATTRSPERVSQVLRAVHGFTRAALDAASTDVPGVLQELIDDPSQSPLVRRQAVKALRLYPGDDTLRFIEARVDVAPLGLRRLYLGALSAYGTVDAVRVGRLLERALTDGDATVRYAAVDAAGQLTSLAPVRDALQARLGAEPDDGVRAAIRQALGTR